MVESEKIEIDNDTWILLNFTKEKVYWMLSIKFVGSCGAASSRPEALKQLIRSYRLNESQRQKINHIDNSPNGEQLELF